MTTTPRALGPAGDAPSIDLTAVGKRYPGGVEALRGIRMQVMPREIFGLLGPNGAGKSTLVKIMMTVVRPTRAVGTVLGAPVGHKPTLARIGYLPEHHRFPNYLTGRQAIETFGALAGIPRRRRRERASELLEITRMSDWADRRIGTYSKGMRQRVGLAAALVNDPDLVLLDEPTDGVDPVGRREIRDVLLQLRAEGMTVFLNSHLLSELEMVCDRVAILVQGEVASQGTIDELTRESRRYEIEIEGPAPPWMTGRTATGADGSLRTTLVLPSPEVDQVQPVIDRLRGERARIVSIRPVRESLEDLFMRAVTDPQTGTVHDPGARRGAGSAAQAPPVEGGRR
ncbi:MAG TPA: ABC transporter ATP-binding protein [Phycisphaerales bacterium]|nr:ABC transporter ATP-binding protein [Phycisphaerales bacterium]HMP35978.1 ABC transporter ATP-binding protein [Phycisphaerales bacterium]